MSVRSARLSKLEPRLREWFTGQFAGPSAIQRLALPHTLAGRSTLILAPTGSGKTLAAFLSVLSMLGGERRLANAVYAIYVSPLRSLTRDIRRNLDAPLAAINGDGRIRVEERTGDTLMPDRARQARQRPHLLLTTPESLSALLSQMAWASAFDATRTVIVDEIHSFAENKRGALLALALERLEQRVARPLQRLGLSATAAPVEAARTLLCGARECALAQLDARKAYRLEIADLPRDTVLPAAGFSPYRTAHVAAALVEKAKCSLVFTSTRSAAEQTGLALKILLPQHEEAIAVHHASIDRKARLDIENRLSEGSLKAVVASSSLELGLDFDGVDQVLLMGAPRGVSRTLQRLGRSGHRVDGVSAGALVPLSLPDLLQCVALRKAALEGRLDPLRPPRAPLDVLAQVLLGLAVERPWQLEEAFALVKRAGPYASLARADFDAVVTYLAGGGKVLGSSGEYGKIVVEADSFRVANARVARQYYLNIGTISDTYALKVVLGPHRRLGQVEEDFVTALQPGEGFVVAGRSVRVKRIHQGTAYVEPAQGEDLKTPRWMGGKMSLTARLAEEELALRRRLRFADDVAAMLVKEYGVPRALAERLDHYCQRQRAAAEIPVDEPVLIERIRRGRTLLYLVHCVAGRGVNRALAWVAGARLGAREEQQEALSIVSNFDDHAFQLSFRAADAPSLEEMRAAFAPAGFEDTLRTALAKTATLGHKFRPIAETAQLLARRTLKAGPARRSSWNATLLYQTLLEHEPDHPLLREAVREVMEDELEASRAAEVAGRLHRATWEVRELRAPSPFALPLFAAFNRETLLAQDPDRAFHEMVEDLYARWA
jgi:ATP-dependent Lhr-like helicase